MTSLLTALSTVGLLCLGAAIGSLVRDRLPDHHIRDDSKDIVKTTSGMVATLVALVIGLLVSSAKSSFDDASDGVTQAGARMILIDRMLGRYGPETQPIRERMKSALQVAIDRLWGTGTSRKEGLVAIEQGRGVDDVLEMIEGLNAVTDKQKQIRSNAISACQDLLQSRWLMIERAQTTLPLPFLAILIFWLSVLFTSFGLLTPRNRTTMLCLLVCALAMASAIALLMEMNRPFEGTIQVSPAPLLKALQVIGK
ncbi:MAG: hypothetical protein U0794_19585 [Isosphaeraceae bacterium]